MIIKNILICGGSYGLGYEIAKNFLDEDKYNVIIISRKKHKLQSAKKKIKSKKLDYFVCDLSNENKVIGLMKILKRKYKTIDLVVSTAGASNMIGTGKENYKEWLRAFNSNFFLHTNTIESFVKFF